MKTLGPGLGSVGTPCTPKQSELQALTERLINLRDRVSIINDNVCGLNARLFGPGPEDKNIGATPCAVPNGSIGYVRYELDNLEKMLNELGENCSHLYHLA